MVAESPNSRGPVEIAKAAKAAFEASQLIDSSERVQALQLIKTELEDLRDEIYAANKEDLVVSGLGLSSIHYWESDNEARLPRKRLKRVVCHRL